MRLSRCHNLVMRLIKFGQYPLVQFVLVPWLNIDIWIREYEITLLKSLSVIIE